MTTPTFTCRRCRERRTTNTDELLCWYCGRMVDPDLVEARRAADRERSKRRRDAEKAARPLHFTPPR